MLEGAKGMFHDRTAIASLIGIGLETLSIAFHRGFMHRALDLPIARFRRQTLLSRATRLTLCRTYAIGHKLLIFIAGFSTAL